MRKRRSEQCHDSVAHDLVDRTLVAMHSLNHVFQNRIQKLSCFLWITVGKQLHRTLHVSEQHRHLLALSFESALGSQNLFGEMLWSVGLRGNELHARRHLG